MRVALLGLLVAWMLFVFSGCATTGKKHRAKASQLDSSGESLNPLLEAEEDIADQSTGDAVPTGPGVEAPTRHIMSTEAKVLYNQGVHAAVSGNIDVAEQAFAQTLSIDPKAYQAAYNIGVVRERKGDDKSAIAHYGKAVTLQADYIAPIEALAKIRIRKGQTTAAVEFLRSKAYDFPKDIHILTAYADVLVVAKRYSDAIDVAKQALKLDERNAGAMIEIGKANFQLGRLELAQAIFEQVLLIDPNASEVYFTKGLIALKEKKKAEAIVHFKSAIEKKPEYVEAMNNLAIQYVLSGNYRLAVHQLSKAIVLSPSWPVLYQNYGNALRGAGKWKAAKAALEKARRLDPSLKEAVFNLGVLYFVAQQLDGLDQLGRWKKAQKYFIAYRANQGANLKKDDPVHKYIKEVHVSIEREQRRQQQLQDQKRADAKRAKERGTGAVGGHQKTGQGAKQRDKSNKKGTQGIGGAADKTPEDSQNDDEWE